MTFEKNREMLRALLILLLASTSACAVETLVTQDFKNFDPKNPPQYWTLAGAEEISVIDDAAKGKVLRLEHKAGAGAGVSVMMNAAGIKGGFHIIVDYKCPTEAAAAGADPRGPLLSLLMMDKDGNRRTVNPDQSPPNVAEWKNMAWNLDIPADCSSLTVTLGTTDAAADVYYSNLKIQADSVVAGQVPAPAQPANPVEPAKPDAAPATPATAPGSAAANAPIKSLDTDGYVFDSGIAQALHDLRKPGATKHTCVFVGPGVPLKDATFGGLKPWKITDGAKEVIGATALPDGLFLSLPKFIATTKPEVVLIVGPLSGTRKPSPDERFDWQDVAGICTRFGAVPILVLPPPGPQDETRQLMIEGARLARCPAIDLKLTSMLSLKARELFDLMETHVFERDASAAPAKPDDKKINAE